MTVHPISSRAFLCFSWLSLSLAAANGTAAEPIIELANRDGRSVILVRGIPARELAALRPAELNRQDWVRVLTVTVANGSADQPSMLGTHRIEGDALVFVPRFPLKPGLEYRVNYQPIGGDQIHTRIVAVSPPAKTEPTRVTHIYPSAEELPENLLRVYLHFSAPMARGRSYRHVQLFEANLPDGDRRVEFPFVEVTPELWDESGRRLTVLFDPGRIKHGLKPNAELGPPLEAGRSYALVVDGRWRDSAGNRLAEPYRKEFTVVAADTTQPDTARWRLTPPTVKTRQPLVVELDEPLDRAMLHRVVQVTGSSGEPVAGNVEVSRDETGWQFTPTEPWRRAEYQVVVDPTLEDLAGNSLARPFEVRLDEPRENQLSTGPRVLHFRASAGGPH